MMLAYATLLCFMIAATHGESNDLLDAEFANWRLRYGKSYPSAKELEYRKIIWRENMAKINAHNVKYALGETSFSMAMNHFGDLNFTEFNSIYSGTRPPLSEEGPVYIPPENAGDIPDEIDWKKKGYVTDVKDQGACGSCWAFSALGALEGQHMRQKGTLVDISPQNLVDCCRVGNTKGCKGGWMSTAFKCVNQEGGIDDEKHYPYTAQDTKICRYQAKYSVQMDFGSKSVKKGSEEDLAIAVATIGPISVAIDTSQDSFQFYYEGVYDEPKCKSDKSDHAVVVVGYGMLNGKKFWLAKNSWSHWWGDKGYIKMSKDKGNQCAIATYAVFPQV